MRNGDDGLLFSVGEPCVGWIGRLFGHKFQPRIHYREERVEGLFTATKIVPKSLKVERVYIHDVCQRCGKVIRKRGNMEQKPIHKVQT